MRKEDNYITFSANKYALEKFKAYRITGFKDGDKSKPLFIPIPLTHEEAKTCGCAYLCGGEEKAISAIKKITRKNEKRKKKYFTYGFRFADNSNNFAFVRQIYTSTKAPIESRLYTFKWVRENLARDNWMFVQSEKAELAGDYGVESVTKNIKHIDKTKMVIVPIRVI